jgi:hypothetical protein
MTKPKKIKLSTEKKRHYRRQSEPPPRKIEPRHAAPRPKK